MSHVDLNLNTNNPFSTQTLKKKNCITQTSSVSCAAGLHHM